jgi:hypothetical protein
LPSIAADNRRNYARAESGRWPLREKAYKRRRLAVKKFESLPVDWSIFLPIAGIAYGL